MISYKELTFDDEDTEEEEQTEHSFQNSFGKHVD